MTEPIKRRILIAEDSNSVALFMQTVLAGQGHEVRLIADGEGCLTETDLFHPDLILLDLMLPKLHGMEVLRRLKGGRATREIGVILCTAKPYKADQDQAMELGAFAVLSKPFQPQRLLDLVASFFAGTEPSAIETVVKPCVTPYLPAISTDQPYFKLWGTRGSIPVSNQRFLRHGGNTSCMEVGFQDELVIVDAGSGIRELGQKLVNAPPRKLHLLITHTHWDHIQGFPFFAPAFVPGFEICVYAAASFRKDLKSVFSGQLDRDYFPVQFDDMRAGIEFQTLDSNLEIGGFEISWEYTHHPAATVAFKFKRNGKALAYVSDNEFLFGHLGAPHGITMESEIAAVHRPLIEFLHGADLLIGEAQYTNEEYRSKIGWGHSSLSNACALAKMTQAKEWIVTHHDPLHDDDFLDDKLNLTKEIMRSLDHPISVRNAYDRMHQLW